MGGMKQRHTSWDTWDDPIKAERPMSASLWACFFESLRRKMDAPERLDGQWVRGRYGVWYEPEGG